MKILKEENLGTMPNETEINMMFYNSDARQHDHNIYRCSICIIIMIIPLGGGGSAIGME
jgi:hypothetical protein